MLGPTAIDDAARQHGEPTLLLVAQAGPQGLGSLGQLHVSRTPGDIRLAMAPQAFDEIGWWASILLFLAQIRLSLRPLARRRLEGGSELLLIG